MALKEISLVPYVSAKPLSTAIFVKYFNDLSFLPDRRGRRLIFAIWDDGAVTYSQNPLRGGEPYVNGRIDDDGVEKLRSELRDISDAFKHIDHQMANIPDASETVFYINHACEKMLVDSNHELFEVRDIFVGRSGAILRHGRSVEALLKKESKEYRLFRANWDRLNAQVDRVKSRVVDKWVFPYIIGVGDEIVINIFDFTSGHTLKITRTVDEQGIFEVPLIGQVRASGLGTELLEKIIEKILRTRGVISDPLVHVVVIKQHGGRAVEPPDQRVVTPVELIDGLGRDGS